MSSEVGCPLQDSSALGLQELLLMDAGDVVSQVCFLLRLDVAAVELTLVLGVLVRLIVVLS